MLYALVVAAIVTAVAEQGDKTQIVSLTLSGRYRARQVLLAVFLADLPLYFVYTAVGNAIGRFLPEVWLALFGAAAFLAFGLLALRPEHAETDVSVSSARGPILTTVGLLLLAQIGEPTALVTVAIASDPLSPLQAAGPTLNVALQAGPAATSLAPWEAFMGVWIGSVIGSLIADGMAIALGAVLGRRMPPAHLRLFSAAVFIAMGAVGLATLLVGRGG